MLSYPNRQNITCFPFSLKLYVNKIWLISTWIWIPMLNDTLGLISIYKDISKSQVAATMMKGYCHAHLTYEYLSWDQLSQNWKLDCKIIFGHKNWQAYLLSLIILSLYFFLFKCVLISFPTLTHPVLLFSHFHPIFLSFVFCFHYLIPPSLP